MKIIPIAKKITVLSTAILGLVFACNRYVKYEQSKPGSLYVIPLLQKVDNGDKHITRREAMNYVRLRCGDDKLTSVRLNSLRGEIERMSFGPLTPTNVAFARREILRAINYAINYIDNTQSSSIPSRRSH